MAITIPSEFGYVILTSAGIGLQCVLSSIAVSGLRKKYNVSYPDSGDGRHAAKLTDAQWEEFHNAQRAHHNYTEQVGIVQGLVLTAGLFHPILTARLAGVYILGRQIYYHGYISKGSEGRLLGVAILDIGLIGLLGTAIHAGLSLAQLI